MSAPGSTNVKGSLKGYLLGIVAAASYGTNPLFALPLYEEGMNVDSVLFFRYLLSLAILAVMMRARGRGFRITLRQGIWLAACGLLLAISSLTLFASYQFMAAGIASTLLFVYPLMVAVIMAIFFRERMSWLTAACLLGATAGIALLLQPSSGPLSTVGVTLVMVSSLSYAIYIVAVNKTGLDHMATLKVTFYVLLFGMALFATRFCCGVRLTVPAAADWALWGNLLALAIFPTAISFLCTTAAIQRVGATATAILGAFEPVTAIFFGIAVFGESLSPRDWLGVALIIAAVILVAGAGETPRLLMRLRKMFPPRRRGNNTGNHT